MEEDKKPLNACGSWSFFLGGGAYVTMPIMTMTVIYITIAPVQLVLLDSTVKPHVSRKSILILSCSCDGCKSRIDHKSVTYYWVS